VEEISPVEIARLLGGSPVDGSAELRILRALQPRLVDPGDQPSDELEEAA